ncbi:hypothetical protein LEP1GSC193_2632 [Leptospira alstonii serovar Pingchang str. 80-412]|uniref:Uncharacterized protein n=2 Tax=Leptospira alstonii TaxID=28452 RepID=M6D9X6_9LEPT|nr:hypothetical protein [Leptospira alstonii]EMJ98063.1 hypothetical protein LEP1GSC194_2672 [Leptospira alstonii serovar Sichuan str. 79601]EQA81131.1 hypothetical protein LEP1GSC193_2632 [Leptospira alstonii serovar Pingchang str. 80-412]
MKTFDVFVLVFGYTFFWTFLFWSFIAAAAAAFWLSLMFFRNKNKSLNKNEADKLKIDHDDLGN